MEFAYVAKGLFPEPLSVEEIIKITILCTSSAISSPSARIRDVMAVDLPRSSQ
jgi:hypothetical protein